MDSPQTQQTPALSEPLLALMKVMQRYQANEVAVEAMQYALNVFAERLARLELPPNMPGTQGRQAGVVQAMTVHEQLVTAYRTAFDELQHGLADGDHARTEAALADMQKADRILHGLFNVISGRYQEHQRQAEEAASIVCPRCDTRNPRGSATCQGCRLTLPLMFSEREETDVIGGVGGPINALGAVQELRMLTRQWQETNDRGPLVQRLESLRETYRRGLKQSESAVQNGRLHADVRKTITGTITSLNGLLGAVEQTEAGVRRGDGNTVQAGLAAMEAHLTDLDSYRHEFQDMEQRFSS